MVGQCPSLPQTVRELVFAIKKPSVIVPAHGCSSESRHYPRVVGDIFRDAHASRDRSEQEHQRLAGQSVRVGECSRVVGTRRRQQRERRSNQVSELRESGVLRVKQVGQRRDIWMTRRLCCAVDQNMLDGIESLVARKTAFDIAFHCGGDIKLGIKDSAGLFRIRLQ